MSSADLTTADEVCDFLAGCLQEHGVDVDSITHYTEEFRNVFYVEKTLGEKRIGSRVTIDFDPPSPKGSTKKRVALHAEEIAKQFHEQMVDLFDWKYGFIELSTHDGGWAKCKYCGNEVDFERGNPLVRKHAESSCPMPHIRDIEKAISDLDGNKECLFKMYMIGKLREECGQNCHEF